MPFPFKTSVIESTDMPMPMYFVKLSNILIISVICHPDWKYLNTPTQSIIKAMSLIQYKSQVAELDCTVGLPTCHTCMNVRVAGKAGQEV